jgi:2'-5' RNA ligase
MKRTEFMDKHAHFFYALKLPEEVKQVMNDHFMSFKDTLPFGSWVHHEDLHITLAFLGSAPEDILSSSRRLVGEAINGFSSFTLEIDQLGFFGKEESPRVLWAHTGEKEELKLLRNKVYNACTVAGFRLETRPFRPHITLARRWKGTEPFVMNKASDLWQRIQDGPIKFHAEEVVLYQTHLERSPKYEVISSYRLK